MRDAGVEPRHRLSGVVAHGNVGRCRGPLAEGVLHRIETDARTIEDSGVAFVVRRATQLKSKDAAGEKATDDPFARGSYSVFDDRSWDRIELLRMPAGRVSFAGEHTAAPHDYAGHRKAAVEAVNRALKDVNEGLKAVAAKEKQVERKENKAENRLQRLEKKDQKLKQ